MWLWHVRAFISAVVIASALPQPTDDSWTEEGMEEDPPLAVGGRAVTCPGAFQVVGDQCLYFAIIFQTDRNGAKQICDSFQGKLVAIREATAMRKIYVYIRNKGYTTRGFWIDGSRDTHGNWNFSDKTPLPMETPFWGASETFSLPKNGTGLNCAAITPDSGFYITNVDCSNTSLSPICEVAPISEGLADENTDADEDFATEIDSIDVTCPPFFVTIPGTSICTAFVTWASVSWGDARQICQGLHGDLFTINDAERFRSLYEYLQAEGYTTRGFWIDGSRDTHGNWNFSDKTPLPMETPFWGASETISLPKNDTGLNCAAITPDSGFYITNGDCSNTSLSPICEVDPISEGLADENTDADEDFATEIDSIDVTCPPFFVTIPGTSICTAFVTWASVSWGDARQICQGLHGDLFTINDAERFRSLYEYLQAEGINNFSFWIGGMRESNVSWVWHDGVPISQGPPFWGLSDIEDHVLEPDGKVGEEQDCVALTFEGKYYFRDKKCSEEYSPMCVAMPIGQ